MVFIWTHSLGGSAVIHKESFVSVNLKRWWTLQIKNISWNEWKIQGKGGRAFASIGGLNTLEYWVAGVIKVWQIFPLVIGHGDGSFRMFWVFCFLCPFFFPLAWSCYIAQAGLKFTILLPWLPSARNIGKKKKKWNVSLSCFNKCCPHMAQRSGTNSSLETVKCHLVPAWFLSLQKEEEEW